MLATCAVVALCMVGLVLIIAHLESGVRYWKWRAATEKCQRKQMTAFLSEVIHEMGAEVLSLREQLRARENEGEEWKQV